MRHLIKLAIILISAAAFGIVFAPLHAATLADALLDFLDEATVTKVTDYLTRTAISRSVGIALLLLFWAAIVLAIDRCVDAALPKALSADRKMNKS
jgi:hypothetical protein